MGTREDVARHLRADAALFAPWASANALRSGEPAPPAALVTLDGQRISTSELLGHVVILTFWATWCGPCREELPLLSAYATQHAAEGLDVLAFTLDSPEELRKVQPVAQSLSFPWGFSLIRFSRVTGVFGAFPLISQSTARAS